MQNGKLLPATEYRLYDDNRVFHIDEFPEADYDYPNEDYVTVVIPDVVLKFIEDFVLEAAERPVM